MIILTSFEEAALLNVDERWSGARFAPGFAKAWPEATWAAPFYPYSMKPIKLRDFGSEPLVPYHEYMLSLYRSRWPEIRAWLASVEGTDLALCCWCPYTLKAREQMRAWGSFHCHLDAVSHVLEGAKVDWDFGQRHFENMSSMWKGLLNL